jgi:hypothetical protein
VVQARVKAALVADDLHVDAARDDDRDAAQVGAHVSLLANLPSPGEFGFGRPASMSPAA